MTKYTESPKTSVKTQRSKMHTCFCILAIVGVFVSMSSAIDFLGFDVVNSILVHPTPQEDQTTQKSDEGLRRKRWLSSLSSTDSTNIINKINSLRASVGASNMNYLTYSSALELDVSNWTLYCEFDAEFYTSLTQTFIVKYVTADPPDHISELEGLFTDPKFYNLFRSVYLRLVGAGQTTCYAALVKGQYYLGPVYLTGYAFTHTSSYNKNQTQFTLGEECTTYESGSYWCDRGLCRDDCSGQISTCTCFSNCTKCQDWKRQSCSCPSQPYTDAVALNCSQPTRGDTSYTPKKAGSSKPHITSWAVVILSTLALFHLQ